VQLPPTPTPLELPPAVVVVVVGPVGAGVVVLVVPVAAGVVVVVVVAPAVKDCGPTLARFMLDHEI
jgi:hypothetical protein